MFSTHPAMGNSGTIPEYRSGPQDAQTPALNPNPHEIAATREPPAGAVSSQPSPMPYLLLPGQMSKEQEARWFQRCQNRADELEAKFYLRLQESQEKWYQRFVKQNQKIQEQSAEIASLIVGSLLPATALYEKNDKMKLEGNFNLRGGLERIVCQAKLIKKIRTDCAPEIQAGLDELAKTPAFIKVLHDEVAARQLALEDVIQCIASIYDGVSKHAYGNDSIITLYEEDHTARECAVLATFLKVQSAWPDGLEWRKEKGRRQTKH
ncbi:hypothetical protein L873DRAFT_1875118 [Choiromyces venosus 120613-1]|uniref:Uncharacterized protein n=1 Tax=Choiromyces venosus 120613-1 TaxID=1336337 RepID=A0A3N4J0H2_9PEZI|nr:hypothetical protein L873DRAFT_1875118 [Choiromyces venosus 120613-1]